MRFLLPFLLCLSACAPFETDRETAMRLLWESRAEEEPQRARSILDEAIELDPEIPDLYLARAEVDRRLRLMADVEADYTLAIALLKRRPESRADLAAAYLGRAGARSEGARPAEAEEDFAEALKLTPANVEIYLHRARARRRSGRDADAAADLERARREGGPGMADQYYNQGVRELNGRRAGEAERLFRLAADLDPGHVRAWMALARCAMEQGRFAAAAESLTKAVELEPNSPELHYHRANAYRAQEKWEEAFSDAIQALDRDARNPMHFVLRGAIYRQYFKDYDNAERDLTQALEIDPTLAAAYEERGQLYHDMRLLNDAERDLRQALGRRGTPEGVLALARVLRDKGEFDKAAEALRGALEIYPDPGVRKTLKAELDRTLAAKEAEK